MGDKQYSVVKEEKYSEGESPMSKIPNVISVCIGGLMAWSEENGVCKIKEGG